MHLVERDSALASLAQYGDEVRRDAGRLVLVAGEAGVGKTALLEEFERSIPGATWAWGACDGLYTPRPLGPLFDIAARLGGDLLSACERSAPREVLFGSLLRQIDTPGQLTVLAIEDIHWADEATLDLLRFLARRLRDLPALVIATYRDDGLATDDRLRLTIGEVLPHRTTRRISLPTLSLAAVAELTAPSAVDPDEAYRLTGGNPFYLREVLEAGGGALPASARDAVLARVTRLSAGARQVLEPAALLGSHLFAHLLHAIVDDANEHLDECLMAGVLVHEEAGLRFRHEIIRLAVQDAIPPLRRGQLHAALLAALRDSDCDDTAELAYHAEGAGDAAAVLAYAPVAARAAACLGAHREALAQYRRALRFAGHADPRLVATMYDGVGHQASLVDRWEEAADARAAALALWRQVGDRLREGDTLRLLSRTMWRLCRGAEASAAAAEGLAVLETLPPSLELAWAYGNLAAQHMLDGHQASALELAEKAIGLGERLGAPEVLSDAFNTRACSLSVLGQPWDEQMRRALDAALGAGAEEQAGRAYANLYNLASSERRFAWAEPTFQDGVAYCEAHDITTYGTCLLGQRSAVLEQLGRWDEAIELARTLLSRPEASPINRLNPLIALGKVLARRGDPDGAVLLTEAAKGALGANESEWIALSHSGLAEAAWLEGREDDAVAALERAGQVAHSCTLWSHAEIDVWRGRLGLPVEPREYPSRLPHGLELAGDHEGAAQAWQRLGCPYESALALAHSADESLLRQALAGFDALGAVAPAAVTRQRMRRLGVKAVPAGPRATTRRHEFQLTRREQDVLDLMAAGLANAEISQRLFISERTVDHHVSSVLRKMNVRSRGAAARKAVRAGIVGDATPSSTVVG